MTVAIEDVLPTAQIRVLGLGEPTHGEEDLLAFRNDAFRRLVERAGFRTLAIESDCLRGLIVDSYVTSGAGTLDEVMAQGFSHGLGASAANRELVAWMRAHNEGRPAAERVRFAGFDGPLEITHAESPRQALTALHDYLAAQLDGDLLPRTLDRPLDELLGDDHRWTNPAVIMDPAQSVGQTAEAAQLRLLADDLVALLDAETPDLIANSSREDWERARLHGRTATGLLRYHHWMADTSPGRIPRLLGVRDSMMAATLLDLAARGPVLAHAHNSHLQRPKSRMQLGDLRPQWWSAGSLVSAHLGAGYAFVATALGTIRHRGVDTPSPDTIEGLLYARPGDRHVVPTRELLAGATPVPRVSSWFGYAPLDPAHLPGIDAIAFLKDSSSSWWPV